MRNQRQNHWRYFLSILVFVSVAACSSNEDASISDAQQSAEELPDSDSGIDTAIEPAEEMLFESYSEIEGLQADPECTLSGKWISVRRTLNYALGDLVAQATHNWAYWEFEQSGTDVLVRKGLKCGLAVIDRSEGDFEARILVGEELWNGLTRNINNTGRKGKYGKTDSGRCFLGLEEHCKMRGATQEYYCQTDSNGEMPDIEGAVEPAAEGNPGWEDWDEDGEPGITFGLGGTVANGKLYLVQREVSQYFGPTDLSVEQFKLRAVWEHWQLEVDKDPISIPSTDSYLAKDPNEHFIIFVRVDNLKNSDGSDLWDISDDADDLDICEKMRAVKDELVVDEVLQADLDFHNK